MSLASRFHSIALLLFAAFVFTHTPKALAETDSGNDAEKEINSTETPEPPPTAKPARRTPPPPKKKYFVTDINRVDAGVFHVAAMVGGNFYTEPAYDSTTGLPNGNYYKDFGFQGGVVFDYDYSEAPDNIPLALRGEILYKYVLSSTNVFAFEGMVRRMFRMSDKASFGIGAGASIGIWYRMVTDSSPEEEVIFLPAFLLQAGFEFNPLMIELKWVVNRIGTTSTLTGAELSIGIRL